MPESVFDTSFLGLANGAMAGVRPGNLLSLRLKALKTVIEGKSRVRYNPKLLNEYDAIVKERRNDIVDQFFEILDSDKAIRLKSSTLRKADNVRANECRWPTHDKHVLAAAIGGKDVTIHVTEKALGGCAPAVKRIFGFTVNLIA